jgi:hypothetical protein
MDDLASGAALTRYDAQAISSSARTDRSLTPTPTGFVEIQHCDRRTGHLTGGTWNPRTA